MHGLCTRCTQERFCNQVQARLPVDSMGRACTCVPIMPAQPRDFKDACGWMRTSESLFSCISICHKSNCFAFACKFLCSKHWMQKTHHFRMSCTRSILFLWLGQSKEEIVWKAEPLSLHSVLAVCVRGFVWSASVPLTSSLN